jgi:hypothetical protein
MPISDRVGWLVFGHWDSQSGVTGNYRNSYTISEAQFSEALAELKSIAAELAALEDELQELGAPWTPGRIPDWP